MNKSPTFLTRSGVELRHRLSRFRREERGSMSVETVLIFPLLVWVYLSMLVFFDGFRSKSMIEKAAYTISDLIGRETEYITPTYMNSIFNMHRLLTNSRHRTKLRVTVIRWDEDRNRWTKVWSVRRGGASSLTNSTLRSSEYTPRLPIVPDDERLIMVETWVVYEPLFDVGPPFFQGYFAQELETMVFSRPRFASQICWNKDPALDPNVAKC